MPRLHDQHQDYVEVEISRLACARMYLLDFFGGVDRAEPVDGLCVEEAEAKVEVNVGEDEERVDEHALVDEKRVVEGFWVEVVAMGVYVSALWVEVVDSEEYWEDREDWDKEA